MTFESTILVLMTSSFAIYFASSLYRHFYSAKVESSEKNRSLKCLREKGVIYVALGAVQILHGYAGNSNKLLIPLGVLFFLFGCFCLHCIKNEKNT